MNDTQPIIIKRIKKGGHAHHGGSWKVAYADFVTAMMAFFLLMWLLTAATPDQKLAIAGYFSNPSAVAGSGGQSTSLINMGSSLDLMNVGLGKAPTPDFKSEEEIRKRAEAIERDRLANLESVLKQQIDDDKELSQHKDQVMIEITDEGLRIQIIDKENRPMFDLGSAVLKPFASRLLRDIATVINKLPNTISLAGHTDATPYGTTNGYTNWELSSDRANASRRELVQGGIEANKIVRVEGLAATKPLLPDDPDNPANRRITILVMKRTVDETIAMEGEAIKSALQAEHKASVAEPIAVPEPVEPPLAVQQPAVESKPPVESRPKPEFRKPQALKPKVVVPPPQEAPVPPPSSVLPGIAPIQLNVNPVQLDIPPVQIEPAPVNKK
ncbi:MAG: hypothetical protein A2V90_06385 [Gammaproteobacteria bacterium RBG_16_57_12]|nr:MAG: hypothetical protein A2V90_06385 [Gammaproteobacteria bacterium RBG_16_57_12]